MSVPSEAFVDAKRSSKPYPGRSDSVLQSDGRPAELTMVTEAGDVTLVEVVTGEVVTAEVVTAEVGATPGAH